MTSLNRWFAQRSAPGPAACSGSRWKSHYPTRDLRISSIPATQIVGICTQHQPWCEVPESHLNPAGISLVAA